MSVNNQRGMQTLNTKKEKAEKLLIGLCDTKGETLRHVMNILEDENMLGILIDVVTRTICECVLKIPAKTHLYASLIAMINNAAPAGKYRDFVKKIVDKFVFTLQISLAGGSDEAMSDVVMILRFFSYLVSMKVIKPEDFFDKLTNLCGKLAGETGGEIVRSGIHHLKTKADNVSLGAVSEKADFDTIWNSAENKTHNHIGGKVGKRFPGSVEFPIYAALLAIPYVSVEMQKEHAESIQGIISTADARLKDLDAFHESNNSAVVDALLFPFSNEGELLRDYSSSSANSTSSSSSSSAKPKRKPTRLDFLLKVLKDPQSHQKSAVIRRGMLKLKDIKTGSPHGPLQSLASLPDKRVAEVVVANKGFRLQYWMPLQEVLTNCNGAFDSNATKETTKAYAQKISEVDQFFLEDYYVRTIDNFWRDQELCAKHLMLTPYLKDVNALDLSAVFVILKSGVLALPSAEQVPLFYQKLLETFTILQVPAEEVANDLIHMLVFRSSSSSSSSSSSASSQSDHISASDNMPPEIRERLADLVAFHISQGADEADFQGRGRMLEKWLDGCGIGDLGDEMKRNAGLHLLVNYSYDTKRGTSL